MAQELLNDMKDVLLTEKNRLINELGKFAHRNTKASSIDFDTDFPNFGDDEGENAAEVAQFSDNLSLENELEKALRDVNDAISRIEKGTYGKCKYCKAQIDEARLRARPHQHPALRAKKRSHKKFNMNRTVFYAIGSLICTVALLDGVLKWFFLAHSTQIIPVIGNFFVLSLFQNTGIAFSLPVPYWLVFIGTFIICMFLIRFIIRERKTSLSSALAAFCVLIGAIGNLVDRIIHGFTTDYAIFFGESAINLSDILIVTGIFFLIVYTTHRKRN